MTLPSLKAQEVAFDDPRSSCFFQPTPEKPVLATPDALAAYGDAVWPCLRVLQRLAKEHQGIDYLQVFTDPTKPEPLWFVEDGDKGAITAILPSEY
jgi:hypothetical protein